MKIIIKIENEKPILFFPEEKEKDGAIGCYSLPDGHCRASRAYMRGLKSPATKAEVIKGWQALAQYARHVAQCEKIRVYRTSRQ